MSKLKTPTLSPGCYFDCARGIYIGKAVQQLALDCRWTGDPILEPEHEHYSDAEDEATDYLRQYVPAGYWIGYADHSGDWGVWANEGEE